MSDPPEPGTARASRLARRVPGGRAAFAWLAAGLVAGVAAALTWWDGDRSEADDPTPMRLPISMPVGFVPSRHTAPAVSPDGRHVVVAEQPAHGHPGRLWVRHLDALAFEPLAGTEGAQSPFWSADSRRIAFVTGGRLATLGIHGGSLQTIAALDGETWGGAWNGDVILLSVGPAARVGSTLVAVPIEGGAPRAVTELDAGHGETGHYAPQILGDGRHVAFLVESADPGQTGVYVAPLDAAHERRRWLAAATNVCLTREHVLFLRGASLNAQPFDTRRLRLQEEAYTIARGVAPGSVGQGLFGCSATGEVVYWPADAHRTQLAWVDRNGTRLATVGSPRAYRQVTLSPDETRVAVELPAADGQYAIWLLALASRIATRLTPASLDATDPVWSADGATVTFAARRDGAWALYRTALDGDQREMLLLQTDERLTPESWTADGQAILLVANGAGAGVGYRWRLHAPSPPERLVEVGDGLADLQVSPDGGWLAYTSRESGRYEAYVQPFGRREDRVRVSSAGGAQPRWRGDGLELYYVTPDGLLMAVSLRRTGTPAVELAWPLFRLEGEWRPGERRYAPGRDGQRFLVQLPPDASPPVPLQMLANWRRDRSPSTQLR